MVYLFVFSNFILLWYRSYFSNGSHLIFRLFTVHQFLNHIMGVVCWLNGEVNLVNFVGRFDGIRVELSLPITCRFGSLLSLSLLVLMTVILFYSAQSFLCVPLLPRFELFMLPPSPVWQAGAPRLKWVAVSLVLSTGETLRGKGAAWFFPLALTACTAIFGKFVAPYKEHCSVHLYVQFSSIYHIAYFCIHFASIYRFTYSCATILSHKFVDSHFNSSHLLKKCCTQIKWIAHQ